MATGSSTELQALKGWKLPARVVRVLGDPRFRVEGTLLALLPLWDGTTWTVEEPGILRHWHTEEGRELQHQHLSELEMLWALGGTQPRLASAADDLTFWNAQTGLANKVIAQPAWISALCFRPDGSVLATGHDDGRVRLWDVASASMIREWGTESSAVSSLSFSTDGQRLAVGREDRSLDLLDCAHGVVIGKLKGHSDRISGIAWHPTTRFFATSSWDTTCRLWNVSQGEQVFILNGQADQVHAVAFSPDGSILASTDSEATIWLWEPFHGKVIRKLKSHVGEVTQLAFTPDGSYLLSGGSDGRLILWNVATGENVLHTTADSTHASRIRLSPKQDQVAAILGGHSIYVWDAQQGTPVKTIESLPSLATAITYQTGTTGLASGHDDGRVYFWNTQTGKQEGQVHDHNTRITSMAIDASGQRLATGGSTDGYVFIMDINTNDIQLLIPGATDGCTVESVAFIPNTTYLAVTGIDWKSSGQEGRITIWNIDKPAKVATTATGGTALAAHPAGNQLAVATLNESICLYSLPELTLERELIGHSGLVTALAYTGDGSKLLTSGSDGTVRVWDVATGKELQVCETDVSIRDLSISQDGRYVYTANANATAYVIDLKRG
ncbi:MAG TPA: WD40 repeat domain-containing protein [Gemmatales bacterium]|nr:WD40 repeat domain-containing protein [Gemmatales bacterium]